MDPNENDPDNLPNPDAPRRGEPADGDLGPESVDHEATASGRRMADPQDGNDAPGDQGFGESDGFDDAAASNAHGTRGEDAGAAPAGHEAPKRRTGLWVGLGVALLAVVLLVVLVMQMLGSRATNHEGADAPVYTPGQSAPASSAPATKAPASSKPATPVPSGCMPTLKEIEPVRFQIDQMKVDSKMLSLGSDSEGGAGAPPLDDNSSVGWWNQGPKVGSSQGHSILTIHTYRNGGALGNKLYDKSSGLKDGDLIRMSDAGGNTQCYTVEKQMKVWVKDYDPNSNLLYSNSGAPRAVIVICWDFNRSKEEWDSRVFYYLKPVAQA